MSEDKQANPFSALFSPVIPNVQQLAPQALAVENADTGPKPQSNEPLDRIARDIFFITCQRMSDTPLVFLEDVASAMSSDARFTITLLGEALFERLLVSDPENHVTSKGADVSSCVIEKRVVSYLFECWQRLQSYNKDDISSDIISEVESLIMRNISTSISQAELYPTQNLAQQTLQLLTDEEPEEMTTFMGLLVKHLINEDGVPALESALHPVLDELSTSVSKTTLLTLNHGLLRAILILARSGPPSAALLVRYSWPRDKKQGKSWADTLLGRFLNLSCISPLSNDSDNMFSDVISQSSALSVRENNIHMALNTVTSGMHAVFEAILRSSPENRKAALDWMWGCLEANLVRGSLWSAYNTSFLDQGLSSMWMVPDGFALNFEVVTLKLCAPFCRPPAGLEESEFTMHPKLLTIDPSFCAVESGPYKRGKLHQQTCLFPPASSDTNEAASREPKRQHSETFTFVTESFFLAQRAIDIGSRIARERLNKLNQDTAKIERLLQQIGGAGANSEATESVHTGLKKTVAQFLAYRTALTEPTFIDLSARLQSSTCSWLIQLLLDDTPMSEPRSSFAPGKLREVKFPVAGEDEVWMQPVWTMQLVPELIIENLASFLVTGRKFHTSTLENPWLLWPALTLVVSLMGSQGRVKNPHLRAKLAEVLEAMLPWLKGEEQWLMEHQSQLPAASRFQRERIFKEHPHRLQIAESLVRVFVDIEMTGQSVTFEQKFSYRHPMYVVLEHLWSLPEHRACFRRLARQAQDNMESVNPPVFLRFANLLINDAVFLLDEALAQMMTLRQAQAERENAVVPQNQPARERDQNEIRQLEHMGGLARSYNILGRETIHTLEMLTTEIKSLFCHATMVDRVAAMLNYFLLQLVGPKSKSLKVHNMKEFEFDPGQVVLDICRIYTHLGDSNEFCAAVSRDGRSYSSQLFPRAETVLARIGGAALLADMQTVAQQVAQQAEKQSYEDELLSEAPDEFLDPITAALMVDPVILPSSQVSIDRPTIARHLLSDQTDPFNRSPLTMDQLVPNDELRQKIETWMAERRAAAASNQQVTQTPD